MSEAVRPESTTNDRCRVIAEPRATDPGGRRQEQKGTSDDASPSRWPSTQPSENSSVQSLPPGASLVVAILPWSTRQEGDETWPGHLVSRPATL